VVIADRLQVTVKIQLTAEVATGVATGCSGPKDDLTEEDLTSVAGEIGNLVGAAFTRTCANPAWPASARCRPCPARGASTCPGGHGLSFAFSVTAPATASSGSAWCRSTRVSAKPPHDLELPNEGGSPRIQKESASPAGMHVMNAQRDLVLLVEDDPDAAATMARQLTAEGYPTRVAATAVEALRLPNRESFVLAIVDISLGGELDGIDVAEWLVRLYGHSGDLREPLPSMTTC